MNYYEFKLNFQYSYINDYSNDLEDLIHEFVMNLYDLFNVNEIKKDYYILSNPNSLNQDFKHKFNELTKNTNKLYEEYQKIYNDFKNQNEIFYSSTFLKLKDKCSRLRSILEKEYPTISEIYDSYSDDQIIQKFNLTLTNKIGTGIIHFKKFYKIKAFIIDNGYSAFSNYSLKKFEFDANNERFFFYATNDEEACVQANFLENLLNKNVKFNKRFGAITILPIYKTLKIQGNPTEFEYTIVFPNGNPDIINEALQMNSEYNAQAITKSIISEHNKKLNGDNINKNILDKKNINGYIKQVACKGAKMIKKIRTK